MNEEFANKLIEYIQKTEDFALEQLPDVVLQALRFEKLSAIWTGCLMTVLIFLGLTIAYYCFTHPNYDKYGLRSFGSGMGIYISLCASAIFFVSLCYCVEKLMKIYIAPKYYLIEIIKGLLN